MITKLIKNNVLLVSSLVLLSACGGTDKDPSSGTFEGTAKGHNGDITVSVVVEDGIIDKIDVIDEEETENIAGPAFGILNESVINNNSTDVDYVTGATVSSEGYLSAIDAALEENDIILKEVDTNETATSEMEDEYEYDVVVVGAGGAGYSAAIEAANQGYSVTILEKLPVTGGNTLISGGEMNAPANWVQEALGIEGDSPEVFFEDTMEAGDDLGDPELVKIMADRALESAEWLRDEVGVEFLEDQLFQFGGHTYERALIPVGHTGQELINKFEATSEKLDIDIYTDTPAVELIFEENKVTGVIAENSNKEITFNANEGVILASGGFGANVDLRKEVNEDFDERYGTTNSPGAMGDGILMAQEIGAAVKNMDQIQTYPVSNPETGAISLLADTRFDGAALINQDGNRFVEELERRDVISNAILDQPGNYTYQIWDHKLGEDTGNLEAHANELDQLLEQELIYVADTLEEGAEYWDIPVDDFLKTIEKINKYAENGEDPDYNHRSGLASIEVAPFYIQKATPSVHHTMGGLVINEKTQVLDENDEVISNLYAAGELTGIIQGANRLGGNAITDIITFGRIAGQEIGSK